MSLPRSVVFYCMGDLGAPHPLIGSRKRFGTATQNATKFVLVKKAVGRSMTSFFDFFCARACIPENFVL